MPGISTLFTGQAALYSQMAANQIAVASDQTLVASGLCAIQAQIMSLQGLALPGHSDGGLQLLETAVDEYFDASNDLGTRSLDLIRLTAAQRRVASIVAILPDEVWQLAASGLRNKDILRARQGDIGDYGFARISRMTSGQESAACAFADGTSAMAASGAKQRPAQRALPDGISDSVHAPDESGGIEDTGVTIEELLRLLKGEFGRIRDRYSEVRDKLDEPVCAAYERELQIIAGRILFWHKQIANLANQFGVELAKYKADIDIGERILLNRILQLGAAVFSEPVDEEALAGIGIRTGIKLGTRRPKDFESISAIPEAKAMVVHALVNFDVGYGRSLMLRPHQIIARNKIWGLIRMRKAVEEGAFVPAELLRGTIVMPVGGGKSRTMVAGFAAAMEEGLFSAERGDKIIVLNHTEKIHEQNMTVTALLGPYFRRRFGRRLKVTEYKGDEKNLAGDVVVVSVPSVNTEQRRKQFEGQLRRELGQDGRIIVAAVDEIHHLELGIGISKEIWLEIMKVLRGISPGLYRIGFTATPTGREGPYIVNMREIDLMRAGVTPRTYLVKVKGENLTHLKVSGQARDFQARTLSSTLLKYPGRNRRLYKELEKFGIRRNDLSPSGRERLEGVVGFAADVAHARMMAADYASYFEGGGTDGLRGRKIEILGDQLGTVSPHALGEALSRYESGEVDAIVAVVSSKTNPRIRSQILNLAGEGKIEATWNVGLWMEGADLYMFTHTLGAKPTFSMIQKGQERGRTNRRGPQDVDSKGRLQNDRPKILFDVIDLHNGDRPLMRYGDMMGVRGHVAAPTGELFDVMAEQVVSSIDLDGRAIKHADLGAPAEEGMGIAKPPTEEMTKPLIAKLWEILEGQYAGDIEIMAQDLGLPVEEMEQILGGKGWINARWFIRRMATLLYQDREALVEIYNGERSSEDKRVSDDDILILRGAMALYEKWEGAAEGGFSVETDIGLGREIAQIPRGMLADLQHGTFSDMQWRRLYRALALYFEGQALASGNRQASARETAHNLRRYIFRREGWHERTGTCRERLLFSARELVALKRGGKLPTRSEIEGVPNQSAESLLTRWLGGEDIEFQPGRTAKEFYGPVKSLLLGIGAEREEIEKLLVDAIFEQQPGWDKRRRTARERLLFEARKVVALEFGGVLPVNCFNDGIAVQGDGAVIRRWLNGEKVKYGKSNTTKNFYSQIWRLLMDYGGKRSEVESLIRDAVFETYPSWKRTAEGAQEKLLLKARELVAPEFGGLLPKNHGIEGVSQSIQERRQIPINRWLRDGNINFSKGCSPKKLYSEVMSLLIKLGMKRGEAEALIIDAVFEQKGWKKERKTARGRLLLKARELVALNFGGELHLKSKLKGVGFQSSKGALKLWLSGKDMTGSCGTSPKKFYSRIRNLLLGLGMEAKDVDELFLDAIFEINGWERAAATAEERLRLKAREVVALKFGGKLTGEHGIKGIPVQQDTTTIYLWLNRRYLRINADPYPQIRALLLHEGANAIEDADSWIELARLEREIRRPWAPLGA